MFIEKNLTISTMLILTILGCSAFGQLNNDILLSQVSGKPDVVYGDGNIHVAWRGAQYLTIDTAFTQISDIIQIPGSSASGDVYPAYNNDKIAFIWEDEHPVLMYSYIKGIFYDIGNGEFSQNFSFYNSAGHYDYDPVFIFLNDTLGAALWVGDGEDILDDILAQFSSLNSGVIGSPIGLNDHHFNQDIESKRGRGVLVSDTCLFVSWIDNSSGNDQAYGRLFTNSFIPIDSSFLISSADDSSDFWSLELVKTVDDKLFAVWSRSSGENWIIEGRWFDVNGNYLTDIYTIDDNSGVAGTDIDMSINLYSQVIVVWEKVINNKSKIYAQRFNENMIKYGEPYRISTNEIEENEYYPSVVFVKDKIYTIWRQSSKTMANKSDVNFISAIDHVTKNNPKDFRLYSNYPNPFNAITTITFSLPEASQVKTEVYDLTGRFVVLLCDRHYSAGIYSAQFDGSALASGIYILRSRMISIENSGKSQVFTRKMMLMK